MLHQIGIGTLGPVFRTYEPTRDRLVAVKVFRLDIVPEQAQLLADALSRAVDASLVHPSIVEPLAAGIEGTVAYRAEEYVAAESLDVAMRHYAPAPIEKALPFITQLAGAIDFARAAGVGHGSLHPRDIFVTPDEARATGFGVVEALEHVGIRAPIRRPYTAPERIEGGPWGTPADVFSLAAISFELLTARRPAGTGAGALPAGDRSEALRAVLARAMDEEPSRRYGTALAFAHALESAAQGHSDAALVPDVAAPVPGPSVPESSAPESLILPTPISKSLVAELFPVPESRVPGPASHVADVPGPIATPGEFAVEKALEPDTDPLDDFALDDVALNEGPIEQTPVHGIANRGAASQAAPTLFDDERSAFAPDPDVPRYGGTRAAFPPDHDAPIGGGAARFVGVAADDATGADAPIDDHASEEPVYAAEEPMFASAEPDPEQHDVTERSGPAILPLAVTLVLGLLGGFAAGYFVGSRDRLTPAAEPAPVPAARPAPAATGAATPEKPGQYSEQKVTAPPPPAGTAAPSAPLPAPAPARPEPDRRAVQEPAPPATQGIAGHLVVRSTPPRAGVMVNGTWRGRTPLTLDALPFGTYVVRVVLDGFNVARQEVTLSARDASQTINARLEPKARGGASLRPTSPEPPTPRPGPGQAPPVSVAGSLYVDSRPRGAAVLLDGKSVGQTPLSLAEVAPGSHVVRIEMAGKKPWTATAHVVAGKMERVTGSLEDKP